MNILKTEYANVWETHREFKLVNIADESFNHVVGVEDMCVMLAVHLNCDCKLTNSPIDDFTLNYLIVDDDKEVFTIDFKYKHNGEEVAIYLENAFGEMVVCFDMSEYIEADERYY